MRVRVSVVFALIAVFIRYDSIFVQGATDTVNNDVEIINYNFTGRIVNGTKASISQFPHQVSLRRTWSGTHFCGGSVISKQLVLTAAHCMYLSDAVIQPWTILVVGGEIQLNHATKTGQRRGVQAIVLHPKFNPTTFENDIAILELKFPFEFTPQLMPATLPMDQVPPGTICQVSGWGYPGEDNTTVTNDLMYVDLPILSMDVCRNLLEGVSTLPPGIFCAGYIEGLKDACKGDSGGGMVCNGVLMGIVSAGEGCARPKLPGIYTEVLYYKHWITYPMAYMRYIVDTDNGNGADTARSTGLTIVSLLSLYALKLLLFT
ncbi:hypothetical protein KPH14_007284 [Odynerus spinipes]|uniref:Peptidase S1 domain-containing protein n=1 Tax=Odynerus spinipes TaxID=1348599 RepID=A0AAD9RA55_9HYME|nr:hypothetical protein KPH14_007284 [Odynerus spinipes]